MRLGRAAALAGLALVGSGAASATQPVTGPVAVYWISASTSTGVGGMGAGGGRPDAATMMAMRQGHRSDPNAVSHTLVLQLGSSRKPEGGDASAEHDPPPGLGVGPSLPLIAPQAQVHEEQPGPPPQYQTPRGRMLIFWGCGEHAGPGQPFVIDFASLGSEEGGRRFKGLMTSLGINAMQPPSPARNATYGEWPNQQSAVQVPADGSLQGPHQIHGNYSPAINFTLAADQDFLPPFQLTQNQRNPSGSASLGWHHVDGAKGYFATMIGGQAGADGGSDVVMWTSSATQAPAFGMAEYLGDGEIARLVASHVLMAPDQTGCTIPQEAVTAVGRAGLFNLVAYGGDSNISSPPRPAPPQPWHVAWEVKIRYRSATSGIVGMDLSQMMGPRGEDQPQRQQHQQQEQPHHSFNPFGGGFIP
jgi:hypothetical protein